MKKKKIIILSIVIVGLLLIVTGVTYSILSFRVEGLLFLILVILMLYIEFILMM